MTTEVGRTDRELQMLEALVDCAYALGMAVGEAAKAEADTKQSFRLYDLFHRSFLAVRMGIRLTMALRAGARPAQLRVERDEPDGPEREHPERERLDIDRPERGDRPDSERERERDYEPVSLPRFLSTLGLVARDAGKATRLPADVRTRTLPALEALLAKAQVGSAPIREPAAPVAALSRPPPAQPSPARTALLGSTAAAMARPRPRPKPPWSASG